MLIDSVARDFLIETIGPQFGKCRFHVINFEETTLLSWVTAILCQPDLNVITTQNHYANRLVGS